ncbi:MAG: iron ABC transporter permease [Gammaproteobacteria bacterium]|jgi:iron complex transport system permease protein|nr:iron ABC transporter permease [Gammaproteobacteria bacterium]
MPAATHPPGRLIGLLLLLSLAGIGAALAVGSAPIPFADVLRALAGAGDEPQRSIVLELRLPRALGAFAVGALLAVSGALLQVLLRNPLADPYVLGTSGGAAVGALLAMLAGLSGTWLNGGAFLGALLATVLVFGLARRGGDWSPARLLLTGIILAAGWGALIAFILTVAPEHNLRGMLFWLMGDLVTGDAPWPALALLIAVLLAGLALARPLNVLARGELQARTLGVAVAPLRNTLYVLAALGTAGAVTLAGSVGFVGLVVPHLLRLAGARDQRILLPACALAGGTLLSFADLLARTLWAPQQLPVGILTAGIGIPVFLFLLLRSRADVRA